MTDKSSKDWHVITKLIKAFGGMTAVLEDRDIITQLHDLALQEERDAIDAILNAPMDNPNWPNQIAMLIGAARVSRSYREIFTIKEK